MSASLTGVRGLGDYFFIGVCCFGEGSLTDVVCFNGVGTLGDGSLGVGSRGGVYSGVGDFTTFGVSSLGICGVASFG